MIRATSFRRVITWTAVVGYGLVASGLPLPCGGSARHGDSPAAKRLATKDRSTPFPCMDKPCGCATAEQCFTACCCHTPAETLAWARSRGLEPAVLRALARRADAAAVPTGGCCRDATADTDAAGSCCAAEAARVPPPPPSAPVGRIVTLRAMLACGGIVAAWSATAAAPPPPRVTPPRLLAPCGAAPACRDEFVSTGRPAPDSPPPRAA